MPARHAKLLALDAQQHHQDRARAAVSKWSHAALNRIN